MQLDGIYFFSIGGTEGRLLYVMYIKILFMYPDLTFSTVRPIYRTSVSLLSRERILYI